MARRKTSDFNPQSLDSMLATIIGKLDAHRSEVCQRFDHQDTKLASIETQAIKTNGRVGVLELWRATSKAKLAGIAAACGAFGSVAIWLAGILLKKP